MGRGRGGKGGEHSGGGGGTGRAGREGTPNILLHPQFQFSRNMPDFVVNKTETRSRHFQERCTTVNTSARNI